jgi:hypothetical protein
MGQWGVECVVITAGKKIQTVVTRGLNSSQKQILQTICQNKRQLHYSV